ncbi:MFS transporter [Pollutimonas subterranea]|uniref:MFS transporter n=1 Tax=Pollutimonas subterranea TaxID=2045210 RepID=A0A2N4TYY4_9BURK|nr:tripartite tricarboxylate transporter substrate binding protein [Pollutimonas subterranea]PLC47974.1 MFS transporter [Pollutimonas subterranea]
MFIKKRRLGLLAAVTASVLISATAHADNYPDKPIRVVVPFPAGGFVDGLARPMMPLMSERLGQQIIIDNKGGAGGTIGTAEAARAQPDGYTFLMVFDSHAVNPHIYSNLAYDSEKDLAAVSRLVRNPLVLLAHPSVQANSVQELVELAKKDPESISYATVGPGSSNHLTAELFARQAGVKLTHIPYRGGGPAQTDLLGGHVSIMFLSSSLAIPHVKSGKLKALAVTSAERSPALADTPTLIESGFADFDVQSWVGLLAPAGTPAPVLARWGEEATHVLNSPEMQDRFKQQGLEVVADSPESFAAFLKKEGDRWGSLIKELGIQIN